MVPYVDMVVAVTVLRVLLFVLHVCLLRECDGARLTAMLVWAMDEVSAGHVTGTRGSGIVDRPRRSDCTAGQMYGEAGWWTTSGNNGLLPLAKVMGVGRQHNRYCV